MSQKRNEAIKKVLSAESEELDAYIASKVTELDSVRTSVKAEKIRRGQIERRAKEAQEKYDRQEEEFRKREKGFKGQLESIARDIAVQTDLYEKTKLGQQQEIDGLALSIKTITKDIKQRETYRKEQEVVIQNTLDDGGARIADLDYQVKDLLRQQQEVLRELESNMATRDALQVEVARITARREQLEAKYGELAKTYHADLTDIKSQINKQKEAGAKLDAKAKLITEHLDAKQRELDARAQVMDEREATLVKERRYLESRKYMYE